MHLTNHLAEQQAATAIHRANAVPYYVDLNRACDAVVRCNDCRKLVTSAQINANRGVTPCCGSRKVREIRTLKFWSEWLPIRLGLIDFPHRAEFLKEFARGRA